MIIEEARPQIIRASEVSTVGGVRVSVVVTVVPVDSVPFHDPIGMAARWSEHEDVTGLAERLAVAAAQARSA